MEPQFRHQARETGGQVPQAGIGASIAYLILASSMHVRVGGMKDRSARTSSS